VAIHCSSKSSRFYHAPKRRFRSKRSSYAGEAARRCLACNTYVNEMRSGAKLGCVVNGMTAGRVPLDALA